MTSSLVGSEMCIRDRQRTPSMTLLVLRVQCISFGTDGNHLPPPRVTAVSYTHLTLPTICSV
eukprot:8797804-Prorocentrum_lima.AAC.1